MKLYIACGAICLSIMGLGLVIPLIPLFVQKYGLSSLNIGIFVAGFGISNFIGCLFWGNLSDRVGRKPVLMITFAGLGITYFLISQSIENYTLLFWGRLVSGFFAGNVPVFFAIAADLTTKENRIKAVSLISGGFSLGLIAGPSLGGLLVGNDISGQNLYLPFLVSGIAYVITLIVFAIFFSESKNTIFDNKNSTLSYLKTLIKQRAFLLNAYFMMFFGFSAIGLEVFLSIWSSQIFGFTALHLGIIWVLVGINTVFFEVVVSRFFYGNKAIYTGLLGMSAVILLIWVQDIYSFIGVLFLLSAGLGVYFPSVATKASNQSSLTKYGMIFGMAVGMEQVGTAMGPTIYGLIVNYSSLNIMWIFAGGMSLVSCAILYFSKQKK